MLDENHFESSLIVQAATYIDRLKAACYDYVIASGEVRASIFRGMQSTLGDLLLFSETAFPESYDAIRKLGLEISDDVGERAGSNVRAEKGHCQACNGMLQPFKTWHHGRMANVFTCECSKALLRQISALERPTGVWAI